MVWNYISRRYQVVQALCSGIGKSAVIYPSAFLTGMAVGTCGLGMIFFVNEVFGATPAQIGLLAATWSSCYVFGCLMFSMVSSRLPPRYSLLLSCSISSACVFSILLTRSLPWCFVLYGIYGAACSLFWPPLMGWLSSDFEGEHLSRTMGWFNLSWSGGVIISPLLAGWMGEIDPRLPLGISAVLHLLNAGMILGAIMVLAGLKGDDRAHMRQGAEPGVTTGGCFLRFPAWAGVFTCWVAAGAILSTFPLSGQSDLHMAKRTIGLFFLVRMAVQALGMGFMGRTSFWHFRGGQMVFGSLGLAVVLLFMTRAGSMIALILAFACFGVFTAQSYFNSMFHGMSGSARRFSRMAMHESIISLGVIFGSATGGMIYQRIDMPCVYLFCASLLVLTAAIQTVMIFMRPQ